MSVETGIWASGLGFEGGGTEKEKKKKEKEEEKIPHMCESIGHRPLRGRCPKRKNGRMARREECKKGKKVGIEGKKRERKEGKNGKKGGMERIE